MHISNPCLENQLQSSILLNIVMPFLLTSEGEGSVNEKYVGLERTRAIVSSLAVELVLKDTIHRMIQYYTQCAK